MERDRGRELPKKFEGYEDLFEGGAPGQQQLSEGLVSSFREQADLYKANLDEVNKLLRVQGNVLNRILFMEMVEGQGWGRVKKALPYLLLAAAVAVVFDLHMRFLLSRLNPMVQEVSSVTAQNKKAVEILLARESDREQVVVAERKDWSKEKDLLFGTLEEVRASHGKNEDLLKKYYDGELKRKELILAGKIDEYEKRLAEIEETNKGLRERSRAAEEDALEASSPRND